MASAATERLEDEALLDRLDDAIDLIRRVAAGLREDRRRREASEGSLRREPPPPPREKCGDELRRARLTVRMSQRELGQELGFSRGIVADAELGRRSCPPLLAAWARRILFQTKQGRG